MLLSEDDPLLGNCAPDRVNSIFVPVRLGTVPGKSYSEIVDQCVSEELFSKALAKEKPVMVGSVTKSQGRALPLDILLFN